MTAKDSAVIMVPQGADVSWPVLCVLACFMCPPEPRVLLGHGNARLASGHLGTVWPRAEVVAAAGGGCGAVPWAEWQGRRAEGMLQTQDEW